MNEPNNITAWLTSPKAARYFGRGFLIRADVLAHLISGRGTLADIAKVHGVSRQAVHKHARKARVIFDLTTSG